MITIAIDGPSAAGKTTTAKKLSDKLNILHLNTGALYRAIAYYVLTNNLDYLNKEEIDKHLDKINVTIKFDSGIQRTLLNDEDISDLLYTSQISEMSSMISSYQSIREKMLATQREIAKSNSVIMEGRDIGSTVLPHATFKFFLIASAENRAVRRLQDLAKKETDITYEQVLEDIKQRDYRDINRKHSPLIKTDDAIEINSNNLTLDEVVEKMYNIVKEGK